MPVPDPDEIDDLVHGRVRLAVLSFLSTARRAEFTLLSKKLGTSDGNLSLHLRKLEKAGYIEITKDFVDRKPRTTTAITESGRKALRQYIQTIRAIIDTVD